MKKILVFLGHPDVASFSAHLATTYEEAAREAGHEVERINISDLTFDPILHLGYKQIQELEPDLKMVQEKIRWADHIAFIYPNWWCSMPAVMKGMFDRMWLPGFAFKFSENGKERSRLLLGKTARVIIVIGTHTPFKTWWKFGDFTNELAHGILSFSGIKPFVTAFGPAEHVPQNKLDAWSHKVASFGRRGV